MAQLGRNIKKYKKKISLNIVGIQKVSGSNMGSFCSSWEKHATSHGYCRELLDIIGHTVHSLLSYISEKRVFITNKNKYIALLLIVNIITAIKSDNINHKIAIFAFKTSILISTIVRQTADNNISGHYLHHFFLFLRCQCFS